jgi:TPR repeat protein
MAQPGSRIKRYSQQELDEIFRQAEEQGEKGNLKSAFRLFLKAAKGGEGGAQNNVGNLYAHGIGVKPNRTLALYWYRRSYRQGYCATAGNIGALYRREGKRRQALAWFERGVAMGDTSANLEIAEIYLERGDKKETVRRLKRVLKGKPYNDVSVADQEEAQRVLERLALQSKE